MGPWLQRRLAAFALLLAPSCLYAAGALTGRVVDENGAAVSGARITLAREGHVLRAESSETGRFELRDVEPAAYELRVEKPGFYVLVNREFRPPADGGPVDLVLNHQQEYEEKVDVVYSAPAIDLEQVPASTGLSSAEIVDLPYPASHEFRNGLVVLPGVVQDNRSRIHLNGGTEDQVLYTLDGFNLADPYTGTFQNRIPVDAIREIRIQNSRYAAEFGKSSAGTLAIESGAGDDHLRYSATNFIPSGRLGQGWVLSKWTPRGYFSGPWRRGRAWFFEAADAQYNLDQVKELPRGANRNSRWRANNLLRNQFLLGRSHVLSSTFLFNHAHENHFGLGPRDPLETTRDLRERNYLVSLKDQRYFPRGALVELGFAGSRLRTLSDPLGTSLYRVTPDGDTGNYFERSRLVSRRWQGLANVVLPGRAWRGRHEWKLGADLTWIGAERWVTRLPFQILRHDGTLRQRTFFTGPAYFRRGNFEQSFYVEDRWLLGERTVLEMGLRQDWNEAVERQAWSPRLALAFAPFRGRDVKLTAGWGLFYDTANLEILARNLDQVREDWLYSDDGLSVVSKTAVRFVVPPLGLRLPRTSNFSAGVEHKIPAGFSLRTGYIGRRTTDAFAFLDSPEAGVFVLGNRRRDRYDALEIRAERPLGKGYRWMGAYTRSSARSNAVLNLSLTNPIFGRQGEGPLDWDAPHRVVSSAWLPLPKQYGLAYLLEWRSGYPFGVNSERSGPVGLPNSRRYPAYFSLNLEVERRFRLWKYQWGLRAGFINLTNRKNPNAVNNTLESANFLHFSGGQGRAFVTRIRFIGKN